MKTFLFFSNLKFVLFLEFVFWDFIHVLPCAPTCAAVMLWSPLMILNAAARVRILEWGLIYYKVSITAQGLPKPSSLWDSTLGTRAAEHIIKAVTGACTCIDGCNLALYLTTPSVASSGICHKKSQFNCMTLSLWPRHKIVSVIIPPNSHTSVKYATLPTTPSSTPSHPIHTIHCSVFSPPKVVRQYDLKKWAHQFQLPKKFNSLSEKNFFHRLLYKNSY